MKKSTLMMTWLLLAVTIVGYSESVASSPPDLVTVWVDDAHTKRITVEELDPDDIAEKTRLSLTLGKAFGHLGISIGWCKETGIDYTEKLQVLIEKIRALCEAFNDSEISLETYRRQMRVLFEAEERARTFRYEMMMQISMDAHKKMKEMDKALGIDPEETETLKADIAEALSMFSRSVGNLPHRAVRDDAGSSAVATDAGDPVISMLEKAQADQREEVLASLEAFNRSVEKEPAQPRLAPQRITIFKDYAHTEQVTVPKLDTDNIVDDVRRSLSLGTRYSGYCLCFDVGPRTTWMLECAAKYDTASQLLILRYKQLCMEFNAGVVCLEGYADRLEKLLEAEERAYQARYALYEYLKEQALAEMDRIFAEEQGLPRSPETDGMESLAQQMLGGAKKELKRKAPTSIVKNMSQDHVADIRNGIEKYQGVIQQIPLGDDGEKISVWVDDARKEKVAVSRLDTDLIAQTTKTRLSLHLAWFNFGPEFAWAKKKGLDYGETAQKLILRYKQLCVDFNAGLLSLAAFQDTRKQIEEAVDRAAATRDRMHQFMQVLKRGAFDEMDRQFDVMRNRK